LFAKRILLLEPDIQFAPSWFSNILLIILQLAPVSNKALATNRGGSFGFLQNNSNSIGNLSKPSVTVEIET
jgi:hypothetical protein